MMNSTPVRLQLDTASDITLISQQTWQLIGKPPIKQTDQRATNASGGKLTLLGEINCDVIRNDVHMIGTCYLTNRPNLNLLGLDWIEGLKLFDIPLNSVCNQIAVKTITLTEPHQITPNPQAPEGKSPAEHIFRRKMRTPHDLMRPSENQIGKRNSRMEHRYNRHHGAVPRTFRVGQHVVVKDYRNRQEKWTFGRITKRVGNVIFEVQVGSDIWIRHANQLRLQNDCIQTTDVSALPFETLLHTFALPENSTSSTAPETGNKEEAKPQRSKRWPERMKYPTRRLQVNPNLQRYVDIQEGGVTSRE